MNFAYALILYAALPALADSVTTSDNLTLFGHVEKMTTSEVLLQARFPGSGSVQTKEMPIPRSRVVRIEFNGTTFNPGAPPGLRPLGAAPVSRPANPDTIVLRGGPPNTCEGAVIEGENIRCGKQEFNRARVIRILLGRR